MYVARKAFRNYGVIILPGSVVEPGSIKWFKTRLKDRDIIEITAHNFEQYAEYFRVRHGVELKKPAVVVPQEATEPKKEPKKEPVKAKIVATIKQ